MSEKIERNCLAAATLYIGAIVADGLSAIDTPSINQSPASMRCTAAVLIACLGAPPLRQRFVFEQRLIIGACLAAVALIGLHDGSEGVRVVDAIYIWLVLSLTLYSFATGGIEDIGQKAKANFKGISAEAPPYVYRESACCLAMATLFYSGMRITRQAFAHSEAARTFQVAGTAWDGSERLTTGYAASSTASVIAIAFGGAVCIGLSVTLFASSELREVGTGAKKELLTSCAFLLLFSAFAATLAWSEQNTVLTAVFGDVACDSETCPAAGLARRMALMNSVPMPLWLNALGTAVLAYAPDAKVQTREDEHVFGAVVVAWGMLSLVGCALTTVVYCSFTGPGAYVDYSVLGAITAIAISSFWDTWYGSLVFLVAIGVDEIMTLTTTPAMELLTYFTHCSLLVSFILLSLRVLASGITEFFWSSLPTNVVALIDDGVGIITIAGTSITTALYLASAALMASYPGNWLPPSSYEQPDNKYARTWASGILEHWLPVLIWLPLYTRKQEVSNVAQTYRLVAWMTALLLPLVLWFVALAVSEQPPNHTMWTYQPAYIFGTLSAALVPWIAISFV